MAARRGCRCRRRGCHVAVAGGNPRTLTQQATPHCNRFRNNYPHATDQNFWKWQYERFMANVPPTAPPVAGAACCQCARPDAAFLRENRSVRTLTWLGHATVLLQTSGVNIITDPHLFRAGVASAVCRAKRQVPLMLAIDELPVIDVVFVSHNHYDHLDAATIRAFSALSVGGVRGAARFQAVVAGEHACPRRRCASSTGGIAPASAA